MKRRSLRVRNRVVGVSMLAALTLALAACSGPAPIVPGADGAGATPSPSSTPSASPTTSSTPPPFPVPVGEPFGEAVWSVSAAYSSRSDAGIVVRGDRLFVLEADRELPTRVTAYSADGVQVWSHEASATDGLSAPTEIDVLSETVAVFEFGKTEASGLDTARDETTVTFLSQRDDDKGTAYGVSGSGGSSGREQELVVIRADGHASVSPLPAGASAPIGVMNGDIAVHVRNDQVFGISVITGNPIK